MDNDSYKDIYSSPYEKKTTVEELDKLLSLAEDASNKVKYLNIEISKTKQKTYWLYGALYFYANALAIIAFSLNITQYEYYRYFFVILFTSSIVMIFPFASTLMGMKRKQMKLREDIQIEHSVLKELLDLISELDSYGRYVKSIDPVSLATIRMRLKRLRFSAE
ncbi:hypothetical protein WN53_03500 [Serratia fonticola]|uniref:hypothetical protein n=1 Tax=Serratia fonticola TaxID=47917 RepID=UPI000464522A|nr:hypothetical protein [Serratia fonticola]AKG68267.1 hypothetical protein WN53_03500 [Serratia fonticola]CAI1526560.1 Uncharacterised protein [Serratia fonticola]